MFGDHSLDFTLVDFKVDNLGTLENTCPRHPRTLRQGLCDIRGVRLTISWHKRRPDHIVDVHQWPQILRFFRGQQVHLQPE